MIVETLEIIGGMAGIIAIIIVIWDHFKDDRLLAKKVKNFYEIIEKLIYTNYKGKIFRDLFRGNDFDQFPQSTKDYIAKTFYRTEKENYLYQGLYTHRILKYSKYFGLVQHPTGEGYFMNEGDVEISETGDLVQSFFSTSKKRGYVKRSSEEISLTDEGFVIIKDYLSSLRAFWRKNYSKRIFRPRLKPKIDYYKLKDVLNEVNQLPR